MGTFSMSHTTSRKSSLPHNRREENFTGKNVDRNGIHEQWFRVEIEDLYEEIFSDSIVKFNAKQRRNDRKMNGGSKEYLDKIRKEWDDYYSKGIHENGKFVRAFTDYDDALRHLNFNKGRNPRSAYYESIVQIGNQENQPPLDVCKQILKEYTDTFQERNPNLRLMEVHFHGDEATPHIHLDFVPFATGYKQGLEVQNGFDKALMEQMGLDRTGTKSKTPSLLWYEAEQKALAEIALSYGVQISSEAVLEPGRKEHESVKTYKARRAAIDEIEDREYNLELREMEVNDESVILQNERYRFAKSSKERDEELNERESLIEARTRDLDRREAELDRQTSERLREAQRALRGAEEEKGRLDEEIARRRAEIARLDRLEMSDRDKAVLAYMKNTRSKQAPDKTIFQLVDDNRMKDKANDLLKRVGGVRENDGFGGLGF